MGYFRRTLGVAIIKAQFFSLSVRLEQLGLSVAAAACRRRHAAELDGQCRLQQQAHEISVRQGWAIYMEWFAETN